MKIKLLILAAICLPFTACETLQAIQAKPLTQFIEGEAVQLAMSYFDHGGNSSTAWGVVQGLHTLGDVLTYSGQSTQTVASNAKAQVKAFADDPTAINGLATGVATIIAKAAPKTAGEKALVVATIANGIGKGAAAVSGS